MSDTTQAQDIPDTELFQSAVEKTTTLEKFENPDLPKPEPKPPDKPVDKTTDKPTDTDREAIPAWRLREQADARRLAEQERDELRARMAAYERQLAGQQKPPASLDIFENPAGFVRQEFETSIKPMFEQLQERFQQSQEAMSRNFAVAQHGAETVQAAYAAMGQSLRMGDAHAKAVYDQAMQGFDPYGVITRWHREREALGQVGGDVEAFKKKIREEALNDPEFHKQAIEHAQAKAKANGQIINRPAQSKVSTTPSLANFGAGGGDEAIQEPSDEQLFRQVVSAKRR